MSVLAGLNTFTTRRLTAWQILLPLLLCGLSMFCFIQWTSSGRFILDSVTRTQSVDVGGENTVQSLVRVVDSPECLKPNTDDLEPDTANLKPDTANLKPDTAKLKPGTAKLKPDTAKLKPDTAKLKPDTANLEPDTGETEIEPNFAEALLARADKNRLIYLSSVDSSYLPMALNLYETSIKKLGIKNYLFACSDTEAFVALKDHGIYSFDFLHDKDSEQPSGYGTPAFRRKTHMKTKIILDALLLGLTVIIMDVDIVLFKDPAPFLDCADCDIQIQSDMSEGNSGFYMARPTKATILLHQKAWAVANENGETVSNQKALDRTMERMSKKKELKVRTLSKDTFPPGLVYFENKVRMFYTDNPPKSEVLVHNNWIVSKAAKIYRFKELLLWMVDTDRYYSDPTRKYLTYENARNSSVKQESEALKTALLIGHLLNRTVILPTFSCANCKYKACKVPSHKCAFNTHFKIEAFDASYENQYREHVFLDHPLVPQTVREKSDIFFIQPPGQMNTSLVPSTAKVVQYTDSKGPTELDIRQWFSHVAAPILRLDSLPDLYGNFQDKSYIQDKAFNTKTDYRQY